MSTEFKTGDLVLCKVGAFAPWPAVVFPQRFLSPDVYRKRKRNCVAVCFFNDPTYYWEYIHKLKPLSEDIIQDFLTQNSNAHHGGKHAAPKDLLGAYKLADKYVSLRVFMRNKFRSESRLNEFNTEIMENGEVESGEDPFWGKIGDDRNVKEDIKPTLKIVTDDKDQIKSESDPENDSNVKNESDLINGKPFQNNNMSSSKHKYHKKLDRNRRIEITMLFRRRMQRNLIQRKTPPGPNDITETHKLLEKVIENLDNDPPFFDEECLRKSKLYKLLKVINCDPKLKEFHPACETILTHWIDTIAKIKKGKERVD
ncbi:similar to Saccharomyces cerevisiae YLR455W Putative protein of unknown function [Maudiozyma barnettii]|uniref:PWWP domain-containing protein n=1 Tax=Maudiozyma barnettii TaxID=61262 RepID=A0A8H2VI03_9SACH|nr:Pdp3p [Kazachstania barnettii]CAB4255599.1 similar to Saccharomyces cerevisiae YLR455W Putative protein of unknown function [Kazachstania barnettii]CAD1784159.1 similar to Saccharomyces cerevisiae YLR455W Putative protein of unknown function [Kazachstania barnettii]